MLKTLTLDQMPNIRSFLPRLATANLSNLRKLTVVLEYGIKGADKVRDLLVSRRERGMEPLELVEIYDSDNKVISNEVMADLKMLAGKLVFSSYYYDSEYDPDDDDD